MAFGSSGRSPSVIRCAECTLRRKTLFHPMTKRDLATIDRMKCEDMIVPAGQDLFRQGGRAENFYTLYDGWGLRYHHLRDGSRQILDVLLPGDMAGLTAVLLGYSAHSVQALTAANFCVLNGDALPGLFRKNPELALALMRTCLADARRADLRATMLGRLSAAERVGYFLIEIYDRLRRRGMVRSGICPCPLRGIDVADAVGLSRVHVMRAFKELRGEALLQRERGNLFIPDFARLAAYTGYATISRAGRLAIL
jgi:CRP-like cAMP-binding protein